MAKAVNKMWVRVAKAGSHKSKEFDLHDDLNPGTTPGFSFQCEKQGVWAANPTCNPARCTVSYAAGLTL